MPKSKTKTTPTTKTKPRRRAIKPQIILPVSEPTADLTQPINTLLPTVTTPIMLNNQILVEKKNNFTFFNILVWTLPVIALSVTAGVWWFRNADQKSLNTEQISNLNSSNTPTKPPLTAIAPLTGQAVTVEAATRRPWAVVVENFFTVRPQSGLKVADIIFEAPTEGGITRFLAIFQSTLPTQVGPVRSARPYFNDWARNFNALYSHSGGTSEALQQLKNKYGGLTDINEFFNEHAYERDENLRPPHNLFTTATRFWNYITNRGLKTTALTPKFLFGELANSTPASQITIPYLPTEYAVTFIYKPETKTYTRWLENKIQTDAVTNLALEPANIIVMFTDITPLPNDPLLRVNLRTLGQGPLKLFTQGQQYQGQWSKTSLDNPLKFLTPTGTALNLTPGQTWIVVVNNSLTPIINSVATLEIK